MEKTLLYLASGQMNDLYAFLSIEHIYLVDHEFSKNFSFFPRYMKSEGFLHYFSHPGLMFLELDALHAIDWFKEKGITFDYVVSINDGIYEGGGTYRMLNDQVMGYLSPLLKDEWILICDPTYCDIGKKLQSARWGCDRIVLNPKDKFYIYPGIFSEVARSEGRYKDPSFGKVFRYTRNRITNSIPMQNRLKVTKVYGSIWDDEKNLDLIGINLKSNYEMRMPKGGYSSTAQFFINKGVLNLHGMSIEEIVAISKHKGIRHLGLCPWQNGNYHGVIQYLNTVDLGSIESVTFYHLDNRDYPNL